jgi:hypothetical protein
MPAPRTELRMMAGFIAMPPTAGLPVFAICTALWGAGYPIFPGGMPANLFATTFSLGLGASVLAFLVTIFAALPSVGWLASRGRLPLRRLLVLGAILGNLIFALVLLGIAIVRVVSGPPSTPFADSWYGVMSAFRTILFGLVTGTVCASVFWAIAIHCTELDE